MPNRPKTEGVSLDAEDAPNTGRPPKLNDEREAIILDALRKGNWVNVAARLAGVSAVTVRNWVKAGEQKPDKYPRMALFAERYREAMAVAEAALVDLIRTGAATDLSHAKWLLERRFGERWQRPETSKLELTGKDGGPLSIDDARAKLDAKLTAIAKNLKPE